MSKKDDLEDIEIIYEQFDKLEDCVNYYGDILASLQELYQKETINKKTFKQRQKFYIEQWKQNERMIQKRGEVSHELDNVKLDKQKNIIGESKREMKLLEELKKKQKKSSAKPPRMKQAEEAAKQHLSQGDQKQSLEPPKTAPQLPPTQQEETNEIETEIEN